jgi:hypothetical protein
LYDPPPLYRDSNGVYHSTRNCPAVPDVEKVTECSYEELGDRRYERCERCVPVPLFVPKPGTTEHPVYHSDLDCRSIPRRLRYPSPQYDWVWWPSWDYEHVIENFDSYRRCKRCIPDRTVLYPSDKKPRSGASSVPKGPHRRRRKAA